MRSNWFEVLSAGSRFELIVANPPYLSAKEVAETAPEVRSFEPLTPHSFSFNSPLGWCKTCDGLGVQIGANPAVLFDVGPGATQDQHP